MSLVSRKSSLKLIVFISYCLFSFLLKGLLTGEVFFNLVDCFITVFLFLLITIFFKITYRFTTTLIVILFVVFNYQNLNSVLLLLINVPKIGMILLTLTFVLLGYLYEYKFIFILIGLSFGSFVSRYLKLVKIPDSNSFNLVELPDKRNLPDIYMFLLDGYTSDYYLNKDFRFKNDLTPFLIKNKFSVLGNSITEYNITYPSLFSAFNFYPISRVDNSIFYIDMNVSNTVDRYLADRNLLQLLSVNGYNLELDSYLFKKHEVNDIKLDYNFLIGFVNGMSFSKYFLFKDVNSKSSKWEYLNFQNKKSSNIFYFKHYTNTHSPFNFKNYVGRKDLNVHGNKYLSSILFQNQITIREINSIHERYLNNKKPYMIVIFGDHGSHLMDISETHGAIFAYFSRGGKYFTPSSALDFSEKFVKAYFYPHMELTKRKPYVNSSYLYR